MKGNTNAEAVKMASGGTSPITWIQRGNTVTVHIRGLAVSSGSNVQVATGLPIPSGVSSGANLNFYMSANYGAQGCLGFILPDGKFCYNSNVSATIYSTITYVTDA